MNSNRRRLLGKHRGQQVGRGACDATLGDKPMTNRAEVTSKA
jgi:hypothetical protein